MDLDYNKITIRKWHEIWHYIQNNYLMVVRNKMNQILFLSPVGPSKGYWGNTLEEHLNHACTDHRCNAFLHCQHPPIPPCRYHHHHHWTPHHQAAHRLSWPQGHPSRDLKTIVRAGHSLFFSRFVLRSFYFHGTLSLYRSFCRFSGSLIAQSLTNKPVVHS